MNAQPYLMQAYDFVHASFSSVNSQVGLLLVALVAAILMKSWKQLFPMAALAVLVDVAVMTLAPLLSRGHGQFRLPDLLSPQTLLGFLALYIGFLIVIAIFYLIKSMFVKTAKA
jgi:hypothetical protein